MSGKIASVAVALLLSASTGQELYAQAPTSLVYQGRLTSASGAPLTGTQSVTFRLYASSSSGTAMWSETHNLTLDENGVFTVELGETDPLDQTVFDGNKRYLGMTLAGGVEMVPRQLISSAPYSVSAGAAVIADLSVTPAKLAPNAVGPTKLADDAVVTPKILDLAVTGPKIANSTILGIKLAPDAVTGDKIFNGTVTDDDIATDAVGFDEIQFKSVTGGQIVDDLRIGGPFGGQAEGNSGYIGTRTRLGDFNVLMGGGDLDEGIINVYSSDGSMTAGLDGETGEVFGNLKSFIVADPTRSDRLIRYSSIEGPEAAIYCRGQVALNAGIAEITFPEHFAAMAAAGTLTVALTPHSLASKGLAAIDVSPAGMTIGELAGGTGSYPVDYVVYAARRGFEDYEVYKSRAAHESNLRLPERPQQENKRVSK